jgi:cell division protein ZipA
MDLDVQDWLIVIGALLILGVLLDAFRRWRNERRNPIKLGKPSFGMGGGFGNEPDPPNTELPSGGARVVHRDADAPPEPAPPRVAARPVPPAPPPRAQRVEPRLDASPSPGAEGVADAALQAVHAGSAAAVATVVSPAEAGEVVVLRLVARSERGFPGAELQRILKACDVRYGPKRTFQRHEEEKGQGAVQFSIVNGIEPGTFESEALEGFSTPSLALFMRLPGPQKPLEAFDCMLETARTIAKYLDGELRDGNNSAFTQQTGDHCRQRISEFALRARTRR